MSIIVSNSEGEVGMMVAQQAIEKGHSALDAIEAGIRAVELAPHVRSVGVGGWPNLIGEMELDASIMDGNTLEAGAVGALQGFLHPISVARKIMENLPHVFLVGEGAARFANEIGAETGEILTELAKSEWESWLHKHVPLKVWTNWPDVPLCEWVNLTADPETAHGTTVFLVQDKQNNIAVGVSTCGWAWKYPGRLGDSPLIGAGSYADNRYGAAACTGMGELAIRASTARSVILYMKMGMTVEQACHEAAADLRAIPRKYKGWVTIYAIDTQGNYCVLPVGRDKQAKYCLWTDTMKSYCLLANNKCELKRLAGNGENN